MAETLVPALHARQVFNVPPADLLVDINLRTDVSLDKAFCDSVKRDGVLVPVVAAQTATGEYRVRYGHRRVAAALKAKLSHVPVWVVGAEDDDQVARVLHQWAENEHRAGLTVTDKVKAIEQLAAFGVTAAAIATRVGTKRDIVDQALAVAKSELASAAAAKYTFLNLDHAAAIAEFEGNNDAVKTLVASAKTGDFEHVAARLRLNRDQAANLADAKASHAHSGYRVAGMDVDDAELESWRDGCKALSLTMLRGAQPDEAGQIRSMTVEEHAACPHRAVRVTSATYTEAGHFVKHFCLDWAEAGHALLDDDSAPAAAGPDPEAVAAAETRAAAREEAQSAWAAAATVRGAYVRELLTRRPNPAVAERLMAALVADVLLIDQEDFYVAFHPVEAAVLAGKIPAPGTELPDGTIQPVDTWDNRTERVPAASAALSVMAPEQALLALYCAAGEVALHHQATGFTVPEGARYLEFIAAIGYGLAGCEIDYIYSATAQPKADD